MSTDTMEVKINIIKRAPMRACPNLECNEEDDLETRQVMSGVHVVCRGCSMRGPGAESIVGAVEMWNELPRLE